MARLNVDTASLTPERSPKQPFKLHPTGRIFSLEAAMHSLDLGGDKRDLFPLDKASIRRLYQSGEIVRVVQQLASFPRYATRQMVVSR
jgi:hypothetical protein